MNGHVILGMRLDVFLVMFPPMLALAWWVSGLIFPDDRSARADSARRPAASLRSGRRAERGRGAIRPVPAVGEAASTRRGADGRPKRRAPS